MAASAEKAPAGKSSKTWLGLNIGWDDASPDDGEARGARGVKARKGSGAWMGARGEEETGIETGRVAGRVAEIGTVAGTVAGGEGGGPAGRVGERSVKRVVTGESIGESEEERPGEGAAISES